MALSPHVVWLFAVTLIVVSATIIMILAAFLLRSCLDDLSNSTTAPSYGLRLFRMVPGLAFAIFGGFLLWETFNHISSRPWPPFGN